MELNRHWAYALLKRMDYVKRTSKSKHMPSNFQSLKESFLSDVVTTFKMEDVPIELVLRIKLGFISCRLPIGPWINVVSNV